MSDENGLKVVVQWMGRIDEKLENIHNDIGNKADREELQELDEKVDKLNTKVSRIVGAWTATSAAFLAWLGFK